MPPRSPKELLDDRVTAELCHMVKHGATVPDLVRHVQQHHGLAASDAFLPTAYLWQTFSIGLNDAKAIGLGHQYVAGTFSDDEINEMVMPHILAQRDKWDTNDSRDE